MQAERAATAQARVIASSVLRGSLQASDFQRPVEGRRLTTLDRLFETHVLEEGVLLANLYASDGTVTYSTDHRLIGTKTDDLEHLREARDGTIRGDVATAGTGASAEPRKALRVYAPVAVRGGTGVVELFEDYAPIAQAAEAAFLPVAGIFELVLVLLFIVLVPILRRVTRRIQRQMEEIEYRALYDELTGLPNRTLFRDRIGQAILAARRERQPATVLILDVDHFREINDTLGHDAGDRLLQELSTRLRTLLRESDTFARLGGDELGILLPSGSVEDASRSRRASTSASRSRSRCTGCRSRSPRASASPSFPDHGDDVDTLLQRADVAMYVAKDSHAGTASYDVEQDTNDAARLKLAGELRRAIEGNELVVHFQPKAELESGRIVGAEALVRWQHPEHGLLSPHEFVPIAERTGLIKPLTRYGPRPRAGACAAWNRTGYNLHVAVNLTIPDLLDLELPDRIAAILDDHRRPPEQLELEITETTILADPFRVRQVLDAAPRDGPAPRDRRLRHRLLVARVPQAPAGADDQDRPVVRLRMCDDSSDATIVRSTIDLGRNLGLTIVAEGVESQEIWDSLCALGCSLAQGYFIGKAVPSEALQALLGPRIASSPLRHAAGA